METHFTNILNKLGLNSGIQLSRWLAERAESATAELPGPGQLSLASAAGRGGVRSPLRWRSDPAGPGRPICRPR